MSHYYMVGSKLLSSNIMEIKDGKEEWTTDVTVVFLLEK